MKYFLGGFNACGKTALIKNIQFCMPTWQIIKGSEALMNAFGIPGDYEKLRKIPQDEKIQKLGEIINSYLYSDGNFILDSHYVNLIRGTREPNTGPWIANFDALLLIDVSPETVLSRMEADAHFRDRALFPTDMPEKDRFSVLSDYISEYKDEFSKLGFLHDLHGEVIDGNQSKRDVFRHFLLFHKEFSECFK